jgi:hypothetical protein
MSIAGCARELPICPISDTLDIAGFVMFGDVEITEKTAAALTGEVPGARHHHHGRIQGHSARLRDGAPRMPPLRRRTQGHQGLHDQPDQGGGQVHHDRSRADAVSSEEDCNNLRNKRI